MAGCSAMLSFYCVALLIGCDDSVRAGQTSGHYRLRFVLFAIGTLVAAMVKPLYLWPVTLLFGWAVVSRRLKLDLRAAGIILVFAVSGCSFLLWNLYAARVNAASPFTRGYLPTANLGIWALVDPQYYFNMIVRRPKWWLGVVGALLYPVGLFAIWSERRDLARTAVLLLLVLIPPTYLLLFPSINRPHDYYQLIITPFLAVVPANALRWLANRASPTLKTSPIVTGLCLSILIAAPFTYLFWFQGGKPDHRILQFERLCAGKVVPGSSALLFVCNDCASSSPNSWLPEYLYAARLWGFATMVQNDASARAHFDEKAPNFPKLEYVIFYGIEKPTWLAAEDFRLTSQDDEQRLYIFQRVPHDRAP
jgi:hypothetical protein